MTVEELEGRMRSREVTEWLAVFTLEAEEVEATRSGRRPPSAAAGRPSPEELRRKLDRVWPITD